jgi:transcription elongation GreA/GreB family factor
MPRNAEAIGKAASKGDLRENWEYKAALEERDRLVERAVRMREELEHARALNAAVISGDEVNVGTAVRLRDVATGSERRIAFLGPWDADIPRGIYSYLAPFSLRFMGKKVADQVRAALDDAEGEFEIVAIEKII